MEILGKLYSPHMPLVYGLCLKYLKNRQQSQDMVMYIFEKLIEALMKSEVKNFKPWLYVLCKNECLMKLRSQQRMDNKVIYIDQQFMEYETIEHHYDEAVLEDDLQRLEHCIEQLNEAQKDCVKSFFLKKKAYQTIAKETGYELKKVKSFIQNGKRNLKICLENSRG